MLNFKHALAVLSIDKKTKYKYCRTFDYKLILIVNVKFTLNML